MISISYTERMKRIIDHANEIIDLIIRHPQMMGSPETRELTAITCLEFILIAKGLPADSAMSTFRSIAARKGHSGPLGVATKGDEFLAEVVEEARDQIAGSSILDFSHSPDLEELLSKAVRGQENAVWNEESREAAARFIMGDGSDGDSVVHLAEDDSQEYRQDDCSRKKKSH